MNDIFSLYFAEDKNSPQFKACVAVLLYRELRRINLIVEEDVVTRRCSWHKRPDSGFDIPYEYNSVGNSIDSTGHCIYAVYRYTGYCSSQYSSDKIDLEKFCKKVAKCVAKYKLESDPGEVQRKIMAFSKEYRNRLIPDRSPLWQRR